MLDLTNSENIYLDFWIKSEYFLNPPFIKLLIDDEIYFEDLVKKIFIYVIKKSLVLLAVIKLKF